MEPRPMFSTQESYNPLQALGLLAAGGILKYALEKAWRSVRPSRPPSDSDLRLKFEALARRVDAIEEATSRNTTAVEHIGAEVAAMRGTLEGIAQRLNRWIASAGQGD